MVGLAEVEKQLQAIGVHARFRFWGHAEILELQHILIPGEQIHNCLNGRYEGGFAVLCATDQRLLLIDKKILHLSVEDLRYDMISEVDYSAQLASATVKVRTPTKDLSFVAFRPRDLRALVNYMQQRVLEIRQQYAFAQQGAQMPIAQAANQAWEPVDYPTPTLTQPLERPMVDQPPQEEPPITVDNAPTMPMPLRNPYMHPPLMMRRRVGRFNPIPAASAPKPSPGT